MLERQLKIQFAHAKGYVKWVEMTVQKQIDKQSVAGKEKYTKLQKELVREISKHTNNLSSNYYISKSTCRCKNENRK